MSHVQTISKGQMEDEIKKTLVTFQEQYMSRVLEPAQAHIVRDILLIRFFGNLSPSELNQAQDNEGCQGIKSIQLRLLEEVQTVLLNIVREITGCLATSLHGNVNTRTGEMLLAITLCEDLEQKLTKERQEQSVLLDD